jgi:hypothetical protein
MAVKNAGSSLSGLRLDNLRSGLVFVAKSVLGYQATMATMGLKEVF